MPEIADPMTRLLYLATASRDEEEYIADALRPVGPLVAVGTPGEILPFAGAARMYLPEEEEVWHQPVSRLIERARLVTLTLGSSAGTMWELTEAMRILPPQRLLLMVPGMTGRAEYEAIRTKNERALKALPEAARNQTWKSNTPPSLPNPPFKEWSGPEIGLIHFSPDWEPTFTRTGSSDLPWENLCTSLIRGLRPTFDQLAAHEEKTRWHCS
ncbi:hypothetical protein AB5L52_14590 [Streptomyces sp. CG4]|uniref:hypothetical protein n=1 Tax=Streptomyces sp. CG4 TaxID=408783 RepID=UPI0034E2C9DB